MTPTTFQMPELRDNLDNIIQAGAYGKKTAFCNAQNTGVLDYINNNLMYLWTNLVDEPTIDSKISAHNTDTNAHADIREALEHVSGVPLGTVIPFSGNNALPNGFLLCNGASVARTMYPDLFNIIGTTYGSVDSEHFNLPDLRDKFIEGADTGGTVKEAGLPNITGAFGLNTGRGSGISSATGAFEGVFNADAAAYHPDTTFGPFHGANFDASRSNSIYGKSTTVQPPSLTMRYIIKAFDGQTEDSALVDITQYENELNNKLDKSGGKVVGPIYGAGNANTLLLMSEPDLVSGSYLALDGKDEPNTAGSFRLEAGKMVDGVRKAYMLIGRTDGSLIWNNNLVATTNKLSMPSTSKIDIAAPNLQPAQWTFFYTAPADGWINVKIYNNVADSSFIISAELDMWDRRFIPSGRSSSLLLPVRKGANVSMYSEAGNARIEGLSFIFAQSAT